jgi:hypothetical protein
MLASQTAQPLRMTCGSLVTVGPYLPQSPGRDDVHVYVHMHMHVHVHVHVHVYVYVHCGETNLGETNLVPERPICLPRGWAEDLGLGLRLGLGFILRLGRRPWVRVEVRVRLHITVGPKTLG